MPLSRSIASVRVPADSVIHLFKRDRVQQRGVPWGAPVMRALRDLDDWTNAELVRKKTEACLVGIVMGADEADQGVAPAVVDADGKTIEQFEPGLIAYARGGKDIKFNQPVNYDEVLIVSEKAVDLSRLNAGAAVLDSHNAYTTQAQVAVVERAAIRDGEGIATIRFPKPGVDESADRLFVLVADRIVRNVSVGYSIE